MADRALRGMQIGAKSMESEEGVVFADRVVQNYICPSGHEFTVTFATEATPPATWECKCGKSADIVGDLDSGDEDKNLKPARTHWDMLRERRTLEELEQVLEEQREALRSGMLRPEGSYRR